jgi:hypothetical protein
VRVHRARRIVSSGKRGSSRPIVVETDAGRFLVKLRGAAQGTLPLVAEIVVAELADALGLDVPRRALVSLDQATDGAERESELARLLAASRGINLGFRFLEGARVIRSDEVAAAGDALACPVLWLDALVMNRDRAARNPNLLVAERKTWLSDHGAALPFHFDWPSVSEQSPRAGYPLESHLFASRATRLGDWDSLLASRISRRVLELALAAVPDAFLEPSLARGTSLERRRAAYEAFLWKRLKSPRPFLDPVQAPGWSH